MNKTFIEVKNDVIELLHEIYDPEIPVNIFDLGLVYEAEVDMENNVHIVMTLTSP
ncbi:MAG TPA: iron-sulfur cluster assembly protein, partial [Chitinophagales bacterium]|nr:iron-sulfur cluster assembly protein [Chitinophagales bacterium]